ncbi:MAG: hypothetical protein FJW37_10810 [Acidobacteria bacterium]|nr:hypothetical protein [Acidobacteriota bacterium]
MSDRAILFLFSVVVIIGSLAAAVWLVASGQAQTVDGLFLLLMVLLLAVAFGLYCVFLIRRAREEAASALPTAKAPLPAQSQVQTQAKSALAPAKAAE